MTKIQKSVRLSKLAIKQLKWLKIQFSMSESEVMQMALNELFRSEETKALEALLQMTDEEIDEQLRQLQIPDGDEETEHPDTQYTDYP